MGDRPTFGYPHPDWCSPHIYPVTPDLFTVSNHREETTTVRISRERTVDQMV